MFECTSGTEMNHLLSQKNINNKNPGKRIFRRLPDKAACRQTYDGNFKNQELFHLLKNSVVIKSMRYFDNLKRQKSQETK